MIKLTFAERYQQARTYAAQVRVRKAMGEKYEHFKPAPSLRRRPQCRC
jgi:hypothetical protein